ncbi:PadR family transcriptional regulator [Paenibacillus stellifer]|uniref:PadR family transcriptional regulator n=1 Tax=Paenibacillus stellifer TaxID=169760 RepID=UPI000A05935C|nr:PadR family transcriptional regulator [Paenibacillus stellifer]
MKLLEFVLLGMLMEGEMSGYDLKKTIDSTVGHFYNASYGSLYPALKRLADKGHVSMKETADSKNRKLYALLPEGREAFMQWLAEPQNSRRELLIRVFFFDYLEEGIRMEHLQGYRHAAEREVRELDAVRSVVESELAGIERPEDYYYRVSVLDYGLMHAKMQREWIQNIMERKSLNHVNPDK